MKRLLYNIVYIALAATASAQEAIDTAQFVAVYDYECRTQDAEGDTRHGQDAGCGAGGTDGDEVDAVIRLSTD